MFGASVTRIRRTQSGSDRYGNPTYTEATSTITGAAFAPGGSIEPAEVGRASVVTTPKLYFLAGSVDLRADDAVTISGQRYTIQGEPAVWVNPWTAATAGTVVELERVDG
jgi:hypothetical protein